MANFWFLVLTLTVFINNCSSQQQDGYEGLTNVIPKTNEQFRKVQLQAIQAYKKRYTRKTWKCSYQDHVDSFSAIPLITPSEERFIFDELNKSKSTTGGTVAGAQNVAKVSESLDIEYLLIWDGVYVNSLEYYNVLYGGYKTVHIGLGTTVPKSFFDFKNEGLYYYELTSCLPFPEWIHKHRDPHIKDFLLVPAHHNTAERNEMGGVAALVSTPLVQTDSAYFLQSELEDDDNSTTTEAPISSSTPSSSKDEKKSLAF